MYMRYGGSGIAGYFRYVGAYTGDHTIICTRLLSSNIYVNVRDIYCWDVTDFRNYSMYVLSGVEYCSLRRDYDYIREDTIHWEGSLNGWYGLLWNLMWHYIFRWVCVYCTISGDRMMDLRSRLDWCS